ncbi:MAG: molybdopterin-dependent oxidoreductase [Acidimicrobiia bacterium]|nr:molybdopterin-dependent oxidoreductase [Acidimicrobiia bacterium]
MATPRRGGTRPGPGGCAGGDTGDDAGTGKSGTDIRTAVSFCRTCEATCGVLVDVLDNRVVGIRADKDHVVTKGYSCMKGLRFGEVHHSPDRLLEPIRRVGGEWRATGWDQALGDIGARMGRIVDEHGPDAMGHFVGSPAGANVLSGAFRGALWSAMGSTRTYGTGTCDTSNKFRVNHEMYGAAMRLAHPDIRRVEFLMVLGANPVVSGNTLYHLPAPARRFNDITRRGGRVVFVNPRRVESSKVGEHLFIRPDTDLFFLAAFCRELIRQGGADKDRAAAHMRGFDQLRDVVDPWSPERQAEVTGVEAGTLRGLVADHIRTDGAALYMATGVNQGRNGTLCFWLLEAINAVSGNLDRPGGTLMGRGLYDMAAVTKDRLGPSFDRGDEFPTVAGQQPAAMLAPDIESGRVRGLIVEASNPLLAVSNPSGRLAEALSRLDLLVCIDLFRNETGNLAHYVLAAPTWLERAEIPYALQSFAGATPVPYITFAEASVQPAPSVRHEWWIYTRLAEEMGLPMPLSPDGLIDAALAAGGVPSSAELVRDHPHGLLIDHDPADTFLGTERVLTDDGLVDLAPAAFLDAFRARAEDLYRRELADRDRMKLIGKREMNRINTSSANAPGLVRETTNYAYLNPCDAERIGVGSGDLVSVSSAFGRVVIPIRVSDEMMPRTVAIPQCWGHDDADGLGHAQDHPGVNSNLLAGDGPDNVEELSGMAHLSGILVEVSAAQHGRR